MHTHAKGPEGHEKGRRVRCMRLLEMHTHPSLLECTRLHAQPSGRAGEQKRRATRRGWDESCMKGTRRDIKASRIKRERVSNAVEAQSKKDETVESIKGGQATRTKRKIGDAQK
eukprot:6189423-Pleurochrysis_carterae.AAC.1